MYDVIVIGAGPAGGQCARELCLRGHKVLLAEKHKDFSVNSYSSAGAPNSIMSEFQLPETIVGSDWNRIAIYSSKESRVWEGKQRGGVVMDFMKLRTFLAEEVQRMGGTVKLGYIYQDHKVEKGVVEVSFKSSSGEPRQKLFTKILVDATGGERGVLAKKIGADSHSFPSTGIEHLVSVPLEVYKKWEGTLSFFMGKDWMPQGYSWIFPMEPGRLKIGVGRYFQNEQCVPHQQSYSYYLDLLMQKCLGSTEFPLIDKHGKTIFYTCERDDPHYDGPVIAIGDAVSTINPLAFEGIRHAMQGARISVKHIHDRLKGVEDAFSHYVTEMDQHFGFSWKLCETLMRLIYREPKDEKVDLMVRAWGMLSYDEFLRAAFGYEMIPLMKFTARYTFLAAKLKISEFTGASPK